MKIRLGIFAALFFLTGFSMHAQGFKNFITVSGNKLMDGKSEFRFLSFNIPNLNYVEDELAFTQPNPYRLPTAFEIRDALESVKQMGGRVVRIYTIPVKREDQPDDVPAYVTGPGQFNEKAFKVTDLMLAIANEVGIRIIFPLVNNWKWMGGRPQYAAFRGKTKDQFWTDPQLIDDVKKTIAFTLNRTNTITGVKYKNDKSILCWETGNELSSPPSWTITMTRYIKSIDTNHLVMDGWARTVREESIEEPSIDIVTTHHYELDPKQTIQDIKNNLTIIKGRKAYIIGEFGFQGTPGLENTMNMIIANDDISGGLIWSLRYHREEGGFYWHTEPLGFGIYKAYHWPGFASGHQYDEKNLVTLIRQKAFEIQGIPTPEMEKPAAPKLLPVNYVYDINWQGSAGASYYNIERAENAAGPWEEVANNVSDAAVQYSALFHDKSALIGKNYYYRILAGNIAGESEPSNVVGPVDVKTQALIDDMSNYGKMYFSNDVLPETGDDRKFKEDMFRMGGKDSSFIEYYVPGEPEEIKVYAFEKGKTRMLKLMTSTDNTDYSKAEVSSADFSQGEDDYDSWLPVLYTCREGLENVKYVKVVFKGEAKISRVEIVYH